MTVTPVKRPWHERPRLTSRSRRGWCACGSRIRVCRAANDAGTGGGLDHQRHLGAGAASRQ
jgi:hypothetical protein